MLQRYPGGTSIHDNNSKNTNRDEWEKLEIVLEYLKGVRGTKPTIHL